MSDTIAIDIPETTGQLPSDIDDVEPTPAPGGITGHLTDAATPEPLPNVTGLTATQMETRLTDLHRAMAGAIGNWSQAGGSGQPGRVYLAMDSGRIFDSEPTAEQLRELGINRNRVVTMDTKSTEAPSDTDALSRLVKSESAALNAADDLRRHAMAILAATERAPVTLPSNFQESAAARFPLLKGQVDSLPMPELVARIRAAITSDDAAALSVYADLVPSRLDSMPDTASPRDRDAAKDLATLVTSIRSRLHEQFPDKDISALNAKATEMLIAAGAARRKAGKRGLKQRSLNRLGRAGERDGLGKVLTHVRDPKTGQPVVDENGGALMRRYDEAEGDFQARRAVEQEQDRFARNRQTLVVRP